MRRLAALIFLTAWGLSGAVRIALVGDSTVNDQGGWGPGFRGSFRADVQVLNLALNSRSSKSFRDEDAWAPALTAKPDYILIQLVITTDQAKVPSARPIRRPHMAPI